MTEYRKLCDWCGNTVRDDTYIMEDGKQFCSESCWRDYHNSELVWEGEGGSILDPGYEMPPLILDPGMEYRQDHKDPGMKHKRG